MGGTLSAPAFLPLLLLSIGPSPAPTLSVCARSNPPFFQQQDGRPSGLEYDILSSFADAEGLTLEVVWPSTFAESFTWLEEGKCDTVASIITRTAERDARMDFSASYFPVRTVLVTPGERPLRSLASLSGKTIATIEHTTYEERLRSVADIHFLFVEREREMFEAVEEGKADALACDSAIVLPYLAEFPSLEITIALSEREYFAFPFRRGSPLRQRLDRHLERLKGSGRYRALLEEYFGRDAAADILAAE